MLPNLPGRSGSGRGGLAGCRAGSAAVQRVFGSLAGEWQGKAAELERKLAAHWPGRARTPRRLAVEALGCGWSASCSAGWFRRGWWASGGGQSRWRCGSRCRCAEGVASAEGSEGALELAASRRRSGWASHTSTALCGRRSSLDPQPSVSGRVGVARGKGTTTWSRRRQRQAASRCGDVSAGSVEAGGPERKGPHEKAPHEGPARRPRMRGPGTKPSPRPEARGRSFRCC